MKKSYRIKGLDCGACAAELERAIKKIPEIKSASVNFILSKLNVEAEDAVYDMALEKALQVIKKLEPDVIVSL